MKNSSKILFLIFFVTVIPTIFIYIQHAYVELLGNFQSIEDGKLVKATKQLGEAILFTAIGMGYIFMTMWIIAQPDRKIPYVVILVGTVLVVIVYYLRIYGIPVLGTDIVITDFSTGDADVITKISQMILVIPISMLLTRISQRDL